MRTYTCICGQLIFFDNTTCVNCGRGLGFLSGPLVLSAIESVGDDTFKAVCTAGKGRLYRKCQNYSQESVCNWMISAESSDVFCASCRLNQVIPDLSIPANRNLWARMEAAKRRLVYSLIRLNLPIGSKLDDPRSGLTFRFLSDTTQPDGTVARVLTGHNEGAITLNVAEADDAAREKIRAEMKEPYRTLLGHFRHEIGHYYWDRLVKGSESLPRYRELFGDERQDYGEALQRHYANGAPADWQERFVSAYATAHPWEDWAETWAHFMHIQDTLEVANDFGLVGKRIRIDPNRSIKPWLSSRQSTLEEVMGAWSELTLALNSINRAMGLQDLYPFVLSPPVIEKLGFIHEVVSGASRPLALKSKAG